MKDIIAPLFVSVIGLIIIALIYINRKNEFYHECEKIHTHQECKVLWLAGNNR